FNLPRISHVESNAIVRPVAAERLSERWFLRTVSLAVSDQQLIGDVVQRATIARLPAGARQVGIRIGVPEVQSERCVGEEARKSAAMDVVVGKPVPENMGSPNAAAVVLELVIALRSFLRCIGAGPGRQVRHQRIEGNREVSEGFAATADCISNLVLKLQ